MRAVATEVPMVVEEDIAELLSAEPEGTTAEVEMVVQTEVVMEADSEVVMEVVMEVAREVTQGGDREGVSEATMVVASMEVVVDIVDH